MKFISRWLRPLAHMVFPRYCAVCGERLREDEAGICLRCNVSLPRTNYHLWRGNPVEQLFYGKLPLEKASSYFFYRRGDVYTHLLEQLKYKGRKDLALHMGIMMAEDLRQSDFFNDIDVLIPVPLYKARLRQRGYNQSWQLAQGISQVTGIPVDSTVLVRTKNTKTQTHLSRMQRADNVAGAFSLVSNAPLQGRHVLLIDDVLTTGATITACADSFLSVPDIKVSILTLAYAGL